ncbi:MAG: ATP-binding protein [Candidatus Aminicenantes bacterium]|nr:ATP-binding protein [Candidatus Aminicenantes bacterium]
MLRDRYLTEAVNEDLREKMVFIGGARQVGKTTFAVDLLGKRFKSPAYFNWDNRSDRREIMAARWPGDADLIILDEIHKLRGWKNLVKGEYDKLKDKYCFLVTGSARLDIVRRGGDSLQGRYQYYRLYPFSLAEMTGRTNDVKIFEEIPIGPDIPIPELEALLEFGGFPEPLFRQNTRFLRRWHNEKIERMFRDDITSIEQVRDLGRMKFLSDLLPERVGSLFSINAVREDLEVGFKAVSNWVTILESFYYHFRIRPYVHRWIRSIKKEPKLYLWDWSEVGEPGARFENLVASHLLKLCHFLYDRDGLKAELSFLRDVDKKEVDFLMTVNRKPWFAVETKLADENVSSDLEYFREKLRIPFAYQVIRKSGVHRLIRGVHVISADRFLAGLV